MIKQLRSIMMFMVLFFVASLSTAQAADESLRITSQALETAIKNNASDYILLDTRPESLYKQGHIKGAQNFPIAWTYQNKQINGKITTPSRMQKILRKLGIDTDSKVIVYDDGSLVDAARLFWALEVYGLKHVKVLDAGFDYWLDQNYPVSDATPSPKPSHYVAEVNQQRLATKFSTLIATKNPNQIIIDARPEPAYIGLESSAARFGHIPKAFNIPASHNFFKHNQMNALQPIDVLKNVYQNIPKNKKVIIYCAIGRISSSNYLALRELGYDVSNYDASWKEWGNDFNLPIINPSHKQPES